VENILIAAKEKQNPAYLYFLFAVCFDWAGMGMDCLFSRSSF